MKRVIFDGKYYHFVVSYDLAIVVAAVVASPPNLDVEGGDAMDLIALVIYGVLCFGLIIIDLRNK